MYKTKLLFNGMVIFALIFATLGSPSFIAHAAKGNDELRADPRLLQMAEENPDATFMVIVQKEAKNKDLEEAEPESDVEKSGGKVTKRIDLIVSFSAEMTGREILKLAKKKKVRWISADAPMVSTAGPGMETVQDEFLVKSYDGNTGMLAWSTNWKESGENTSPYFGLIQVVGDSNCAGGSGYCLRLDPYKPGTHVSRAVDLSGLVSVNLSFWRNNLLNSNLGIGEEVKLEISSNGGASWTTLQTYSSLLNIGAATDSFNISAYAGSGTQIRFLISKYQSGSRHIFFDNIEITFARPSAFLQTIKADQLGLNGNGVTVAVLDSGIASSHPDFTINSAYNDSRVIAETKFGSLLTAGDMYGHGTHVAGIVGGNGTASNGKYKGVAPGVNLVNIRVSNDLGMTYESDVVAGLEWIYHNKDTYNIRVVNISMNSTVAQSYHTSPLSAAVEVLWFNGIVVVVSTGNNGTGAGPVTLYPPANDPFVITVGATEDKGTSSLGDDKLAVFSSYGVTEDGFAKPDLVAPGRNIVAPLASSLAVVYRDHPNHRVNEHYFRMSGTSMSAPVVSGAIALLLQDEPNLNPDQIKYRLVNTANRNWPGYDSTQSGSGYLDIYSAVNSSTTQSANTGIMASQMLSTGTDPILWSNAGWNSVGWNSVGWNSVGWNSAGWNSVGWNSTWDD